MDKETTFYRQQAAMQRASAAETTLDNVRERCERAALAWETMAERSERTTGLRLDREAATRSRASLDAE